MFYIQKWATPLCAADKKTLVESNHPSQESRPTTSRRATRQPRQPYTVDRAPPTTHRVRAQSSIEEEEYTRHEGGQGGRGYKLAKQSFCILHFAFPANPGPNSRHREAQEKGHSTVNMQFIRKSWMDRLHTQHTSTSTCNKKAPIAKTTTIGQTIVYYLLLPCGGTHRDRKVGRRQLHNCTTAPLHGCTLFNVSMSACQDMSAAASP